MSKQVIENKNILYFNIYNIKITNFKFIFLNYIVIVPTIKLDISNITTYILK